jgi:trans-2,3-dihydro-3-hydroxyanthranilate isomerase
MKQPTFYMVDVFAEEKYTGNQLAVVKDVKGLSDREMQKIANEMHYSETTFITSEEKRNGGYDVRIFTPEKEIPFGGHPTLGTAYVIQRFIIKKPINLIVLNLKVGQIPVTINYINDSLDLLWMTQVPPQFGRTFTAKEISEVLNLEINEIDDTVPIQEVSTGLPTIIVPLCTLEAVKQVEVARDKYYKLITNTQAKTILIFAPQTYHKDNDLNVRFFADYYGIPEDPATGSGNGCLVGYLMKHHYFNSDSLNLRVEQGYELGRPSLLHLKGKNVDGTIEVYVGGKVVMVAKGEYV